MGGGFCDMFNVCTNCGHYRVDKTITQPASVAEISDPDGQVSSRLGTRHALATCPQCGHPHPFLQRPLLLVGGASATGKTTILQELTGQFTDAVLLEADLLWLEEFQDPTDGYPRFKETWLRMAKNIGQSGRPVALFGAGLAVPENIEQCVERRYFSQTHYLALVCDEVELRRRLQARPAWRKSAQPEELAAQLDFNRWLRTEGPSQAPPVTILDTTFAPVEESAAAVANWMELVLALEPPRPK